MSYASTCVLGARLGKSVEVRGANNIGIEFMMANPGVSRETVIVAHQNAGRTCSVLRLTKLVVVFKGVSAGERELSAQTYTFQRKTGPSDPIRFSAHVPRSTGSGDGDTNGSSVGIQQ